MTAPHSSSSTVPHPGLGFREFLALMGAMMAINALAVDAMLPALPQMGAALGVIQENTRQTIITAYLLGFGVGQLFYGSLSDRFGRRPVVLFGLIVFGLFALASAFAATLPQMLIARFLQGAGAAATRVVVLSIVRDCYAGRRMASVMSLVMIVFITVPVIAPSLGQAIVLVGPWQWIFVVLAVTGFAIAAWGALRLPETLPPERRSALSPAAILNNLRVILRSRPTVGYALASATIFGCLLGFVNSAQQIFGDIFELGVMFPVYFSIIAVFMAVASFLNSRVVERLGMRQVSHAAVVAYIVLGVGHLAVALAGVESLVLFIGFQSLQMFAFGLMMSNFNALAMDPVARVAGLASSLIGFTSTVGGAVAGHYIGQAFDGTIVPLTAGFLICGLLTLAVVLVTERGKLFRSSDGVADSPSPAAQE